MGYVKRLEERLDTADRCVGMTVLAEPLHGLLYEITVVGTLDDSLYGTTTTGSIVGVPAGTVRSVL